MMMTKKLDEPHQYDDLQRHIAFSKELYVLNRVGRNILREFADKKAVRVKRSGAAELEDEVDKVYHAISNTVATDSFSSKPGNELAYNLDELLMHQTPDIDTFFYNDETYNTTRMYYAQHEWVSDIDDRQLDVLLDASTAFSDNDAAFLVCFLRQYDAFIDRLDAYATELETRVVAAGKLRASLRGIKRRHANAHAVLQAALESILASDSDASSSATDPSGTSPPRQAASFMGRTKKKAREHGSPQRAEDKEAAASAV
jgi:hypothetical protein